MCRGGGDDNDDEFDDLKASEPTEATLEGTNVEGSLTYMHDTQELQEQRWLFSQTVADKS